MPVTTDKTIVKDIIQNMLSDECNQPLLNDDTECCLEDYNGCCCNCKFQTPIHADFPISSLYCYVCLFKIAGQVFINTTHGICGHYNPKNKK